MWSVSLLYTAACSLFHTQQYMSRRSWHVFNFVVYTLQLTGYHGSVVSIPFVIISAHVLLNTAYVGESRSCGGYRTLISAQKTSLNVRVTARRSKHSKVLWLIPGAARVGPKARPAAAIVTSHGCAYWIGRCRCWLVCSLRVTEVVTKFFLFEGLWSWNFDTRSSSVFDVFCWSPFWKLATIDRVRCCRNSQFSVPKTDEQRKPPKKQIVCI